MQKIVFYISIFAIQNDPMKHTYMLYMIFAIIGALFSIIAWWKLRLHSYSPSIAFLLILCHSILISLFFVFNILIFAKSFVILIIPALVFICVAAGLLCDFKGYLGISFVCGLAFIFLFWVAQSQNIVQDPSTIGFLPSILIFFFLLTMPIGYVSHKMQTGERNWKDALEKLNQLNKQMETAQDILSRYVAPQLARKIFEGEAEIEADHYRQKLSLFFSDIKDFTATTDAMEAEDLADLVNKYLDEMLTIAVAYGGTVAQISGDGLFVFFGAPEYIDDEKHALHCVWMAIAMQQRMHTLKTQWFESGIEHPFRIRCGANTGIATVGNFGSKGRKEYTAIGMQVNLAARLEAACEPGQILISHTTWGLIKNKIPCVEKESIKMKGFHQHVRTYQVDLSEANKPDEIELLSKSKI